MKILLLIIISLTFYSCVTKNVLNYSKLPLYKEKNSYQIFSNTIVLRQSISYDDPKKVDEEYSFGATIMVKEKSLIDGKRLFDIVSDSIYYFHQLPRVSFSESRSSYTFIGTIEFIEWDSTHIVLKEHIDVIDSLSKVTKRYRGTINFERTGGNLKLYFD